MTPAFKQDHAEIARRALLAANKDQHEPLETKIQDLLTNLAHLADAEKLNFVEIVTHALRHWQLERIDPASVLEGPVVEIHIGSEGLPSKPTPKKRLGKPKKVRVPR